ncbi:MAG: cyclic nucleotide-binding domain-containing protein [Gammaproteobacteria bacterium]|nr:cyclic nucleotide-binding domain-containing protein [Gammaproteobacteria bacterium]
MAVNELKELFAHRHFSCSRCKQSGHCLVASLSPPAISKLSDGIGLSQTLRRGNHLYHAGDDLKSIYIIQSGIIKTYSSDNTGSETVLSVYLPTEVMGFEAVETSTHPHSAVAIETSSYCMISYDRLLKACREDRDFQRDVWRLCSQEIRIRGASAAVTGTQELEGKSGPQHH